MPEVAEAQPEVQPEALQLIWQTAPEGYHDGLIYVQCHLHGRGLYMISWQGGWIKAHVKNMILPADHRCLLRDGAPVIFRTFHDEERNENQAIDVNLNFLVEVPEVEESVFTEWKGTWGLAKRPCGCDIVVAGLSLPDVTPYSGMKIRHRHIVDNVRVRAASVQVIDSTCPAIPEPDETAAT